MLYCISVTPFGISIDVNDVHSLNASCSIVVKFDDNLIDCNELQRINAFIPICVTESGIST